MNILCEQLMFSVKLADISTRCSSHPHGMKDLHCFSIATVTESNITSELLQLRVL